VSRLRMKTPIRTAVFPAGGLGTRLLPATRSVPKEMLTVVDQPVIQYVVAEAREAGIDRFVFVISPQKRAIEDHFSGGKALKEILEGRGATSAIAVMNRDLPPVDAISFALQPTPMGLGHAVWCARRFVRDEPFAILLPDVIMRGEPGCLSQLMETYNVEGGNVVSIAECDPDRTSQFGIVDPAEAISTIAFRIKGAVEKPPPGSAPSNLRLNGRYILQPKVFEYLANAAPGAGGEIQLTDALAHLVREQALTGHRFHGRSFDCGSKEGLIAANVVLALANAELAPLVLRECGTFPLANGRD